MHAGCRSHLTTSIHCMFHTAGTSRDDRNLQAILIRVRNDRGLGLVRLRNCPDVASSAVLLHPALGSARPTIFSRITSVKALAGVGSMTLAVLRSDESEALARAQLDELSTPRRSSPVSTNTPHDSSSSLAKAGLSSKHRSLAGCRRIGVRGEALMIARRSGADCMRRGDGLSGEGVGRSGMSVRFAADDERHRARIESSRGEGLGVLVVRPNPSALRASSIKSVDVRAGISSSAPRALRN